MVRLIHLGHIFLNFTNGSFRWADIQHFQLSGPEEPLLRTWAEQYAPLTADLHAALDRKLYQPLRAADRTYRLRDLGPGAYHDWGGVHCEFHELVLLDHAAGTLSVVIAGDD